MYSLRFSKKSALQNLLYFLIKHLFGVLNTMGNMQIGMVSCNGHHTMLYGGKYEKWTVQRNTTQDSLILNLAYAHDVD